MALFSDLAVFSILSLNIPFYYFREINGYITNRSEVSATTGIALELWKSDQVFAGHSTGSGKLYSGADIF